MALVEEEDCERWERVWVWAVRGAVGGVVRARRARAARLEAMVVVVEGLC